MKGAERKEEGRGECMYIEREESKKDYLLVFFQLRTHTKRNTK